MPFHARKLIYHVATTLDGFIADKGGQFPLAALTGAHVEDYLAALQTEYDTVLMGRHTYEVGIALGVADPYPHLHTYVVSRTLKSTHEHVQVIAEDILSRVCALKAQRGKHIYLCGGGELAAQLVAAKLVDELWLKLNPLLYGGGKPLCPALAAPQALRLMSTQSYPNGVQLLKYLLDVS